MKEQESFIDIINTYLKSGKTQLPVFDRTGLLVQQEIAKKEPDSRSIEKLIVQDQALTSQVLKTANSTFYKGLVKVATVREAIIRMGLIEIGNIVLLLSQRKIFRAKDHAVRKMMGKLWQHSVCCAIGTQWLARFCGFQSLLQESFIAGLLHDVGKLFLLTVIEDIINSKKNGFQLSTALFNEVMDILHTEQGYSLLKEWNLPDSYCVIARDHHKDEYDSNDMLLTMVRLTDQACKKLGIGLVEDPSILLGAAAEAHTLGVSEVSLAEFEIKLEDSLSIAQAN